MSTRMLIVELRGHCTGISSTVVLHVEVRSAAVRNVVIVQKVKPFAAS
jgi:hypothetical protein